MEGQFANQVLTVYVELIKWSVVDGIRTYVDHNRAIDDACQTSTVDAAAIGIVVVAKVIEIASTNVDKGGGIGGSGFQSEVVYVALIFLLLIIVINEFVIAFIINEVNHFKVTVKHPEVAIDGVVRASEKLVCLAAYHVDGFQSRMAPCGVERDFVAAAVDVPMHPTVLDVDRLVASNKALVASAIHILKHIAAQDGDMSAAIHLTSGWAVMRNALVVNILVNASTAAVHIAPTPKCTFGSYFAIAFNEHMGITLLDDFLLGVIGVLPFETVHVAVLAAAKHRAIYLGITLDGDVGLKHIGKVGEHHTRIALACAKHIAVFAILGADSCISTYYNCSMPKIGKIGRGVVFRFQGFVGAHRSGAASAVNRAFHPAIVDFNLGAYAHLAGSGAVVALFVQVDAAPSAIHVAFLARNPIDH